MKNLEILHIIKSFSKDEVREFGKFLRSPFFNNQSTIVRMFDAIIAYYPDFDNEMPGRKIIFRSVHPDRSFNPVLFRKHVSQLTKIAEEFLVIKNLNKDPDHKSMFLLKEFYRRRLNKKYVKSLRKTESKFAGQQIGEDYFLNRHLVEEIKINYELMNEHLPLDKRLIYDTQYYLFNYFITLTGNNLTELLNLTSAEELNRSKDPVMSFIRNFDFEGFIEQLGHVPQEQMFTIRMNYYSLMMIIKPEDMSYYYSMKKLFRMFSDTLNEDSLYIYHAKLNNYAVRSVSSGNNSFLKEVFDNYDFALHNEKYISKLRKNLTFAEFRNILQYSLELHNYEWAKWFVENFIDLVQTAKRRNLREYASAFLEFEQKHFEKALSHLSRVEHIHPVIKFDTGLLMSKIYYELDYPEACYSLIDSLTHLVKRSTFLSDRNKVQVMNYIKHYKKLLDFKSSRRKRPDSLLEHEIQKEKIIKSREWLMEKAHDILKNRKKR